MKVVSLLDFLNNSSDLHTTVYNACDFELFNFLSLLDKDSFFINKFNLGLVYLHTITMNKYVIVDGTNRLLSLSLLLHALCECYKKTSPEHDKEIKTIRKKYLLNGSRLKLQLPPGKQKIYHKIIFGERLSGKEKKSKMFKLLHSFWSQIKSEKIEVEDIFNVLKKISIICVDVNNIPMRDLYYTLNKEKDEINHFLMIEDFLSEHKLKDEWDKIKEIFEYSELDLKLFFKDYFLAKLEIKTYQNKFLYETFVNYAEEMFKYLSPQEFIKKIYNSALLYKDIINIIFQDNELKDLFIKIKIHKGEDTYFYLLNIYEDYTDNSITKEVFVEILKTVDEYLQNRLRTPNEMPFSELINYLNAFITCK